LSGNIKEAEELYRKALEVQERVLRPNHPATLETIVLIASSLANQGKPKVAETWFRRALTGHERGGMITVDSVCCALNLASILYYYGGDYLNEAEQLHRRALDGLEKFYGPEHEHTLSSLEWFCRSLFCRGPTRYKEVEVLNRRLLAAREKAFGHYHPKTMESFHLLVELLGRIGGDGIKEAETIVRKEIDKRRTELGARHRDTFICMYWLAYLHNLKGEYELTASLCQEVIHGLQPTDGEDDVTKTHYLELANSTEACARPKIRRWMPKRKLWFQRRKKMGPNI